MLSDGCLQRRGNSNARFLFAQSGKDNKREYFNLVFSLCIPFMTPTAIALGAVVKEFVHTTTGAIYSKVSISTMGLPCFTALHTLFYLNGTKVVPSNIAELLTPCGLAHWIMGDGSKHNKGLHLSVYAFSTADVKLLVAALTAMGLTVTIHSHVSGPRIYVHEASMPHLRSLVVPYMVPSMYYKVSL